MDSDFARRRDRHRDLFGSDVAAYADGRPGYPDELFELLRERCGLGDGTATLEIGPGTGQVTASLLAHGASVVAVELNANFGEYLRARFGEAPLEVLDGPFEDIDLGARRFDLVVSGTAFHWVPSDVGLARSADALRRGGWLALWWNHYGDPDRPDPFHDALQPMLAEKAPELTFEVARSAAPVGAHPHALDVEARTAEIDGCGRFGPVSFDVIPWTGVHTADEIGAMFSTFSNWIAVEQPRREELLDGVCDIAEREFGGLVERPYLTAIYTAQRR